ncbi:hypothetical protein Ocin01_17837 [Orchesella cincta]|uniref:Uncharacterized protein n=1 Tax=Orchesella cincta TaxID=48709 RepID=A0A1D2M7E5_ORCCI|nr:hypothetical protein Ocin01_17837 [Orchesella cincta]
MFEIYHDNFTTLRDRHKRPCQMDRRVHFQHWNNRHQPTVLLLPGNMQAFAMDHVCFWPASQLWAGRGNPKREDYVMELNSLACKCVDNLFLVWQDEFGLAAAIRSSGASSTRSTYCAQWFVVQSLPMFIGARFPERKREVHIKRQTKLVKGQGHMELVLVILFVAFFIWLFQKE